MAARPAAQKSTGDASGEHRHHQVRVNVGGAQAKRRRNSARAPQHRCFKFWTGAMLAGIAGAASMALFCSRGSGSYPALWEFLRSANDAATRALGGDVEAACSDPSRWLNTAGHDLLSGLPGSQQYNSSMLWGTYRPGVYFGLKTRTTLPAITAGLMWHGGDGRAGVDALRHDCNEADALGSYGWVEHDGLSYGKQEITDKRAGVRLLTSMVKPFQLGRRDRTKSIQSDVHVASRVEVTPLGAAKTSQSEPPRLLSTYFYIGVDCDGREDEQAHSAQLDGSWAGLAVLDGDPAVNRPLIVQGSHAELGAFNLEANIVSADDANTSNRSGVAEDRAISYVGKRGVPIADVKNSLETMHKEHWRLHRRSKPPRDTARPPFVLSNTVEPGSNLIILQVTGYAPFSVDFTIRTRDAASGAPPISAETVARWLEMGSASFSERFSDSFGLEEKGFGATEVTAAKAALSNMLGGLGYFQGHSEVRGAGQDGANGPSFGASLFTAVPSRSFFPRGFLWDEGFHQLLVSAWDTSISVDVLGHWLSVMHVHASAHVTGGWIPREQILGHEARKRVPAEFVAQDISVANPPTLLLVVDKLLGDAAVVEAAGNRDKHSADTCATEGSASAEPFVACAADSDDSAPEERAVAVFLRKAQPLLDQWVQWLLITQRPGTEGWGGQGASSPAGAFQWKGRDASDDRLNALTLASGLDDYPRASDPSHVEERHVDVLAWLTMACNVMDRLSAVTGMRTVPYGEIARELGTGLFDLHWDSEEEAFFDFGRHSSDGEMINEAVMRCKKDDGSTMDIGARLEDLQARKSVCPRGQQHMYPLGDGKGGLLVRRRWLGGSPRLQNVQHIGYVSIFPLLLKLLPPDSQAVGSLLAQMRNPALLWSPHGLRSLSASDAYYQVENNPGDEPYWRGHIWVNVNYLALAALRHYSQAEGPFRNEAGRIYAELRTNLLHTLLGGYHSTGYFWEQYDDRSGKGLRSHPFTGWTALVVLIMAEQY